MASIDQVMEEEINDENPNARLEHSWLMQCLDDVIEEMVTEEGISVEVAEQIWNEALKGMDREVKENKHLPDMQIKSAKLAGYRYTFSISI